MGSVSSHILSYLSPLLSVLQCSALYTYRNTGAGSCNHRCSGKAISITYTECVFVALSIQRAMCVSHIVVCGLLGFTTFSHIISLTTQLKKKVIGHKMCFDFL
jgi:hypothetical protein